MDFSIFFCQSRHCFIPFSHQLFKVCDSYTCFLSDNFYHYKFILSFLIICTLSTIDIINIFQFSFNFQYSEATFLICVCGRKKMLLSFTFIVVFIYWHYLRIYHLKSACTFGRHSTAQVQKNFRQLDSLSFFLFFRCILIFFLIVSRHLIYNLTSSQLTADFCTLLPMDVCSNLC